MFINDIHNKITFRTENTCELFKSTMFCTVFINTQTRKKKNECADWHLEQVKFSTCDIAQNV